jgi:hypothetical protein
MAWTAWPRCAAAEREIIALGLQLKGLEAQLKTCRGG